MATRPTSEGTALTLLVAHHLADRHGEGDPADFLADHDSSELDKF